MMEYFTYKKVKKHQAKKRAEAQTQAPLLDQEDENFLQRIVSVEGTPPPLPDRPHGLGTEAGDARGNNSQVAVHDGAATNNGNLNHDDKGKGKENAKAEKKESKKPSRFSFLQRSFSKKDKNTGLSPNQSVTANEASKEEDDINKVLDDLNLAAINNRVFSVSKESQVLVQKFTVILKDLINGVPTAYDDLTHLLDDSQNTLSKSYEHLPGFLKKLITQLPNKLTGHLAPELLAVATEAQALNMATSTSGGGFSAAAKSFLKPSSLKDLVAKPGAVVSLLKAIMNALKLRWPAFMGTNVLLSVGLFVLLFVFWYCHKRGRETRLEREKMVDSNGRVVELEDDAMLGDAGPSTATVRSRSADHNRDHTRDRDRDRDRERGNGNLDPGHRHSSSREHSHGNGHTTRTEGRPTSSRARSSDHSRRPKSSEYAIAT